MLLQDPATFTRPGAETIPPPAQPQSTPTVRPKIDVAKMNFYYGDNRVLHDVTVQMLPNHVTALIGPSGCGKSTFLRSLNRMNDIIPGARVEGSVCIDNRNIYDSSVDVVESAAPRRDGLPEVEPVPEIDLRERRVRPAHQPHGGVARRAGRARRSQPQGGGALGRSEGSPAHLGAVALRRPAAAAVHRARAGGRAGDPADGRARVGARPRSPRSASKS